jgi:hypothetical protein
MMTRSNAATNLIAATALAAFLIAQAAAQTQPQAKRQAAPAQPAMANPENPGQAKPAKKATKKPHGAKPATQAKTEAKTGAKTEAKKEAKKEAPVERRDPFRSLVAEKHSGAELPTNLPPGKAGLLIGSVRVDGMVRAPSGMIAVVSNPQQRVYFIREGDRLYDGQVEHIGLDGVVFKQSSKDAFGRPVERLVTKRLYPTAGEQE